MSDYGSQNMVSQLKKVLMKKPQKFMSDVDKIKWNYGNPLNQDLIEKNYNDFIEIIRKSEIEIFYIKLDNEDEELCDSIFTHDPSFVINEGAIILNMNKALRKNEIYYHIKKYVSLNIPIIGKIIDEGRVEGGDCIWINNTTLLVGTGYRTNIEGVRQLNNILKNYNINVIHTELPKISNYNSCFHLMSIISMLDHDLVIGYEKFISTELSNILKKYNIEIIKIPEKEYLDSKTLAVNILALSPRNLIMLRGYNKTADLLLKSGCKINFFYGDELCIKAEGGPTCLTRPILRI